MSVASAWSIVEDVEPSQAILLSIKLFVESILGLKVDNGANRQQLNGVVELLIEIRKQAKENKDFATSDKIRNQLAQMGIQLKDEKDGSISYSL